MKLHPDLNDVLRNEGEAAVRERLARARPYQRSESQTNGPDEQAETENKKPSRIRLIPFDEITFEIEGIYLIDNLIPLDGITVIWGPKKSLKSFAALDMNMHVALGWKYRGRRVEQGPAVYCAFEGQAGIRRRIAAFKKRFLANREDPVQFYLQELRLDLVKDHAALIAEIRTTFSDIKPVVITLDTLNRSIRGSESSDSDMTAYVNAAEAIREAFGCAVIIVHHSGLDETRMRGHTSLPGAIDAQISVKRPGMGRVFIMTVELLKDGREGDVLAGRLENVLLGTDKHGKEITSCVVIEEAVPDAVLDAETEIKRGKVKPNEKTMLGFLEDARPLGLTLDEWNKRGRDYGIGARRRSDFLDIRRALQKHGLIYTSGDKWFAK